MPFVHTPARIRYPVALAIGVGALAARWFLDPVIGPRQPYLGCLVGTVAATLTCGFAPGFATLVVTFLASEWLFYVPGAEPLSHPIRFVASLITFAFGTIIVWLMSAQRRAHDRALAEADRAHVRQQQLECEVERRQALEAELRLSREEFRTLVNRAPVGIMGADIDGRCTFANEKWQALTGLSARDTLGHAWSRAIHPDDIASTMARWTESVEGRKPYVNELRIVDADGTIHPVLAAALPIRDASGTVVSFIGTVMDLTDLHQREEMLRRLIDTQEKEKQSLCHEFHDGLIQHAVGSRMLLEAYLRDHPHVPQRDLLETVIGELDRGIADGRMLIRGIRTAVLDDLGLVDALHDLVDSSAATGLTVHATIPPTLGPLPAALETTVYRVVQESLSNVRRHAGVTTASLSLDRTDDRIDLAVSDAGCGFEPAGARGRGFGLTGMTERVRLAGGDCQIDSAPGEGTRIRVTLPVPPAGSTPPAQR